jgi:hypothetical protein
MPDRKRNNRMGSNRGGPRGTRYPALGFEWRGDHWRILDNATGSAVGPIYKTRKELLADLDRFAREFGCA